MFKQERLASSAWAGGAYLTASRQTSNIDCGAFDIPSPADSNFLGMVRDFQVFDASRVVTVLIHAGSNDPTIANKYRPDFPLLMLRFTTKINGFAQPPELCS
jgi:hypothetical protein